MSKLRLVSFADGPWFVIDDESKKIVRHGDDWRKDFEQLLKDFPESTIGEILECYIFMAVPESQWDNFLESIK